jgi:tetratricopeptide (TPR) repeat protein
MGRRRHAKAGAHVGVERDGDRPVSRETFSPAVALGIAIVTVAILVFAAHRPALSANALSFDDGEYLTDNLLVQNPSWASARRFLTEVSRPSTVAGYYQPLAMISLMLDCAMGGRPDYLRPFHRTSLGLHIANTSLIVVLLYVLLGSEPRGSSPWSSSRREASEDHGDKPRGSPQRPRPVAPDAAMTADGYAPGTTRDQRTRIARVFIAAMVGLLFGLHPLTVEPIPWVGERKTLLAAFFSLWCLIFYVRYAGSRGRLAYAACLLTYVLALMSKPTSTALPAVMLLLDFWPLGRLGSRAFWEKIPFFAVGGVSAVITVVSQSGTAAVLMPGMHSPWRIPLILCHNTVFYLRKIVWPANLSSHYPFPVPFTLANYAVLAGVVGTCILIPALALSLRWTRAPLTGWLIFFVTILPTMQIIGFTNVIASDKFAYLPSVGLLLVVAWALSRLWNVLYRNAWPRGACAGAIGVFVVLAASEAMATQRALVPWQNTEALFDHMIRLAPNAPSTYFGLGAYLAAQGRFTEARDAFTESLRLDGNQQGVLADLGVVFLSLGQAEKAVECLNQAMAMSPSSSKVPTIRTYLAMAASAQGNDDEAIRQLNQALKLNPDAANTHYNLGDILAKRRRYAEAVAQFEEVLRLKPGFAKAHCHMADALGEQGKGEEAVRHYRSALSIDPSYADAHCNLAAELVAQGKFDEAVPHATAALRLRPEFPKAQYNLAVALAKQNRTDEAVEHLREALRLRPEFPEAHNNLGALLQGQGKTDEAIKHFRDAVRLKPDYLDAHFNLGLVLEVRGSIEEAIDQYHQALRLDPKNAAIRERLDAALDKQANATQP